MVTKGRGAAKSFLQHPERGRINWPRNARQQGRNENGLAHQLPSANRVAAPAMLASCAQLKGAELDRRFDTPYREADHAPPKLRILSDDPELQNLKVLERWAAAQKVSGVEARILELRLISQETHTDDLRGAIDDAIEDCELHLVELLPSLLPSAN